MTFYINHAIPFGAAALMGVSATALSAENLEFYFPVGVNAPAVATIQELTDEWAAMNPQHSQMTFSDCMQRARHAPRGS